jgi:hypothetical protein
VVTNCRLKKTYDRQYKNGRGAAVLLNYRRLRKALKKLPALFTNLEPQYQDFIFNAMDFFLKMQDQADQNRSNEKP